MASKKSAGGRPDRSEGFETLYHRLEESVAKLEEGGLTLEESLALYEEGMKLARRCQELLRDAELRVSRLQEGFAEGLQELREEGEEYTTGPEVPVSQDEMPLE